VRLSVRLFLTDKADALVLADYCRKEDPPTWRAAAPEVRLLVALMRRLQNLKDQLVQETNRLSEPGVLKRAQGGAAIVA